jgi:hypothetical protein
VPEYGERRVYDRGEVVAAPVCGHPSIGADPSKRVALSRVCPEGVERQRALDNDGSVKTLGRRGRAARGDGPTDNH